MILHSNGEVNGSSVEQENRLLRPFASIMEDGAGMNSALCTSVGPLLQFSWTNHSRERRSHGTGSDLRYTGTWRVQIRGDEPKNHGTVESFVLTPSTKYSVDELSVSTFV